LEDYTEIVNSEELSLNEIRKQPGVTRLYFEFRELTDTEINNSELYSTNPPIVCPAIYVPPVGKRLIITKIFDYK